ncbi:hypothetical protein BS641_00065 [Mycobacterium avium subsp. hominissuis]|uniref:hypothetical protein n=1 Tax=Mycobacterium avium TaxID=1764 RepID=UPI0004A193BD|nr:hypothetical protein [Mycobacterium avium]APT08927.1 hypothetical protein BS641_00065 [Mycobacterium avium subsp. hominissuis]KDP03566.1 hypothetical protein MAV3388_00055 [Mycobacterium avium subsp. hominissuis 3388]
MAELPNFLRLAPSDRSGLRTTAQLPVPLPYHLRCEDVMRLLEDLHLLLHELNVQLHERGYERLEELLDPAGFSGLLSRAIVDGIRRQSRALDRNEYHNGYPDLVPHGVYPGNSVQHGTEGGLEVKASRYPSGWQTHGPRAGWFCIVQFILDDDTSVAIQQRAPTQIVAVMIAELAMDDWSWAPAAPGRIRSGTASVRPSGAEKLRAGAVWVHPGYEAEHQELLLRARLRGFTERANHVVHHILASSGTTPLSKMDIVHRAAQAESIANPERIRSAVEGALRHLRESGAINVAGRGTYVAASHHSDQA